MKESTQEMMKKVAKTHDWQKGQVWSGGGTEYHSTDLCRVCSLRRHWRSDRQNGIVDEYRFSDGETGEDLSLRQVLARGCA